MMNSNTDKRKKKLGYQHFLLFPPCFQTASFSRSGLWGKELRDQEKKYIIDFPPNFAGQTVINDGHIKS